MTNQGKGSVHNGHDEIDRLFSCLAASERRRLLGILYEQAPDSLTLRALASALIQRGIPGAQKSQRTVTNVRSSLYHTQLPKLEAAGLVERDTEQGTVRITDHRAFQDPGIVECLTGEAPGDVETFDSLFGALADARRRTILDVLSHQFQPIHTETLAREIGAKERGLCESAVPEAIVDQILVSLHHTDLPRLEQAGLIEHDDEDQTVAYEGHPALRVAWMHSVLIPGFRASLTNEPDDREMGTIEGREKVISYGQSLGERADEELFCLFTHTDMMEAGCFTRVLDAARRGVDVYIGTYDPTIREYVQENVPEVTLWEPKTDWLNLPVEGNRVGRLLMADREAVMLGTLKEETNGGFPEEKAIVGDGADNTLVVMLRQMLSTHLDQIDEQTADPEQSLPF